MRPMSEERTRDLPDNRSFEERVFARFDAMEARFEARFERWNLVRMVRCAVEARFDWMRASTSSIPACKL